MNNIFVNIHGWLKDNWVLTLFALVAGALTTYMDVQNVPLVWLGALILVLIVMVQGYNSWDQLQRVDRYNTNYIQSLNRETEERLAIRDRAAEELRAQLHAAGVSAAELNDLVNNQKETLAQNDQAINERDRRIATLTEQVDLFEAAANKARGEVEVAQMHRNVLRSELLDATNVLQGTLKVLASAYPSGIRRENFLNKLVTFLYVDLPGDQVRFACPVYDAKAGPLATDTKAFVEFLDSLPPYEKAWDGHLPTMVPDRLNKLADQVHALRTQPVIGVAATGKPPAKSRVAKKRSRAQNP